MRNIVLSLMLLIISSVALAGSNGGSPELYRVAKGAVVEITESFYAGSHTVDFKKGQKAGWFTVGSTDPKCRLVFKKTPNEEVKDGRYRVIKTSHDEFANGDSQFTLTTALFLSTINGPPATRIECTQSGYYNESDIGPITVQTFKYTVGNYLEITFDSE